jgi:hypothetical protein
MNGLYSTNISIGTNKILWGHYVINGVKSGEWTEMNGGLLQHTLT